MLLISTYPFYDGIQNILRFGQDIKRIKGAYLSKDKLIVSENQDGLMYRAQLFNVEDEEVCDNLTLLIVALVEQRKGLLPSQLRARQAENLRRIINYLEKQPFVDITDFSKWKEGLDEAVAA